MIAITCKLKIINCYVFAFRALFFNVLMVADDERSLLVALIGMLVEIGQVLLDTEECL